MKIRRVGTAGLLIECPDAQRVEDWRAELWKRRAAGELRVVEIVPGARTVLLDGAAPGTAEALPGWEPAPGGIQAEGPLVEIHTVFDGEDLESVADLWRVTVDTAVRRLVETPLTVAFSGFAPGFAYLRGLADEWAVPRLAAPRPRVPAGSVALAGGYAGIYPTASPGGWRLVGRTDQNLFDVRREHPALLTPGTRVRLVAV
ncbi:KipI family sensor histidine kinase inhibitor [Actinoplanes campanulatus]|uniref:KipI family sensor histidine kinase inhibitor n=1 Tax=Actinoplanes campanulatus TaxID=113559 RepID=A0A7W5APP2_9ACTN|nr:allophanate hydrolase subunit 1 [Actinoplanes campanulatus]MBB3099689.1 KipI family sensor histidine kinase inhibitor [Actinoplanes campanulatus]GGN25724.1 allophanate hydrolase [Actinoplanes campanulatus]GID39370.1 allophanate hydrolase [Actinoplanes campanulatus]